jgi:hypothetical protein
MITADTLKVLTTFTAPALTRAATDAGYDGPEFSSCKFLGITNGGQFCYKVVFPVKGGTDSTKVFLTYDHANDRVIADYQLTNWA